MILNLFTVYDVKAGLFLQPFFMRTKGEALRAFVDLVGDPGHTFARHPEDFSLYHVGEFNEGDCSINTFEQPEQMATALQIAALSESQSEQASDANGELKPLGPVFQKIQSELRGEE